MQTPGLDSASAEAGATAQQAMAAAEAPAAARCHSCKHREAGGSAPDLRSPSAWGRAPEPEVMTLVAARAPPAGPAKLSGLMPWTPAPSSKPSLCQDPLPPLLVPSGTADPVLPVCSRPLCRLSLPDP